jgi:serine/threonine protein kinase
METTNSDTNPRCQACGTPLAALSANPGEAPLCPACLLGLGLQPAAETLDWSPDSPAGGGDVGDRVPDVAQLMQYFPNLEIQHLIGYGGMGAVYQARQPHLDRTVALKILSPRLSRNEAFAQRFMREARTLAKLAHPNIVMVFEFGQAGPLHYLLLEFVDGVNLRDAMLEGQLTTVEALAIVPQLCDALQYAHDEGVVHRDIKPENILLDKRGRVKIADFGLAKLMQPQSDERRLTGTRQVLGTLNYMAPEQIEGRNQIDHRADIYSLGVVFYELLTGELPLGRFAVPSEKARVDARLDQVVLRTLEKEPQRRYQQASQVKSAMQELSVVEAIPADASAAVAAAGDAFGAKAALPPLGLPPELAAPVPQPKPASPAYTHPWTSPDPRPFNQPLEPFGPRELAVPFTIDQVNWGFASASGLLKTSAQGISIEYEVRDCMFQKRIKPPTTVVLPWSSIATAKYQEGLLKDTLTFQATSIAATADVPEASGGSFSVSIKKIDRGDGKRLAAEIQRHLSPAVSGGNGGSHPTSWAALHPSPPWATAWQQSLAYALQFLPNFWTQRPINTIRVTARFATPQFWFVTCGVLNFVFLTSKMRQMARELVQPMIEVSSSSMAYPLAQFLKNANTVINPFSSHFGNGYFTWSIVFSILLFTLSERLQQLRSYNYIVLVCAIALIPFYPTYIFCAPWALVTLVLLLLPSSLAAFDQVDEDGKIRWDGPPLGKSEPSLGDLMSHDPLRFVARMGMVGGVLGSLLLVGLYFLAVPRVVYESSSGFDTRPMDTDDVHYHVLPADPRPLPAGGTPAEATPAEGAASGEGAVTPTAAQAAPGLAPTEPSPTDALEASPKGESVDGR